MDIVRSPWAEVRASLGWQRRRDPDHAKGKARPACFRFKLRADRPIGTRLIERTRLTRRDAASRRDAVSRRDAADRSARPIRGGDAPDQDPRSIESLRPGPTAGVRGSVAPSRSRPRTQRALGGHRAAPPEAYFSKTPPGSANALNPSPLPPGSREKIGPRSPAPAAKREWR